MEKTSNNSPEGSKGKADKALGKARGEEQDSGNGNSGGSGNSGTETQAGVVVTLVVAVEIQTNNR